MAGSMRTLSDRRTDRRCWLHKDSRRVLKSVYWEMNNNINIENSISLDRKSVDNKIHFVSKSLHSTRDNLHIQNDFNTSNHRSFPGNEYSVLIVIRSIQRVANSFSLSRVPRWKGRFSANSLTSFTWGWFDFVLYEEMCSLLGIKWFYFGWNF